MKLINDQETWEKLVLGHPQVNFLQSYNWGQFQQSLGKKVFRLGFYQGHKLTGVALIIKETAKRGTYLTCPGGPLLDKDLKLFPKFVATIKALARVEGASFIRVRPQLLDEIKNRQLFKSQGFIPAPMHMHAETTWQLDLNQSLEVIKAQMRKTTRHSLGRAEKLGVKIKVTTKPAAIKRLYDLQVATAKRQKFVPFGWEFLKQQFEIFSQAGQLEIFEAYIQGQLVASAMIIFYGQEGVYHYSGSNQLARDSQASYLIQWQAIQAAKKRSLKHYNFWGVVPGYQPKHRFWGVTVFKTGFGGFPVNYLHAHDLPVKLSYWPVYLFEKLRKFYRHL